MFRVDYAKVQSRSIRSSYSMDSFLGRFRSAAGWKGRSAFEVYVLQKASSSRKQYFWKRLLCITTYIHSCYSKYIKVGDKITEMRIMFWRRITLAIFCIHMFGYVMYCLRVKHECRTNATDSENTSGIELIHKSDHRPGMNGRMHFGNIWRDPFGKTQAQYNSL